MKKDREEHLIVDLLFKIPEGSSILMFNGKWENQFKISNYMISLNSILLKRTLSILRMMVFGVIFTTQSSRIFTEF